MYGYLDWLLLKETFETLEIPYPITNRYVRRIRHMTDVIIAYNLDFLSEKATLFSTFYGITNLIFLYPTCELIVR